MKLSVSLPDEDVEFIDRYLASEDVMSRSAVIQQAIGLLRVHSLQDDYASAFDEWADETETWDGVTADGIEQADHSDLVGR